MKNNSEEKLNAAIESISKAYASVRDFFQQQKNRFNRLAWVQKFKSAFGVQLLRRGLDRLKLSMDKSLSKATRRQVWSVIFTLVTGFCIFWLANKIFRNPVQDDSRIIELMLDPGAFGGDGKPEGFMPRLFEFLIVLFGSIFFSGIIISLMSNVIGGRVEKFKQGLRDYHFTDHILILGANRMLPSMLEAFFQKEDFRKKDIVVLSNRNIEELRAAMIAKVDNRKLERVTYLYGSRDSVEELERAHAREACRIYILGEENEVEHDSINIASFIKLDQLCMGLVEPIKCFMVIDNLTSYHVLLFQQQMIGGNVQQSSKLKLNVINSLENWAQMVLVSRKYAVSEQENIIYPAIDREGIDADSSKRVHFVVVGMTQMAITMANTVAHIAHYPNFNESDEKTRTKITFICPDICQEMNFYKGHYSSLFQLCHSRYIGWDADGKQVVRTEEPDPAFGDFLDVEWEFVDGGIETPQVRALFQQWADPKGPCADDILTISICGKDPQGNNAAALYLPDIIFEEQIPIFVHYPVMGEILEQAHKTMRYSNIYPFGMHHDCFDYSLETRLGWAKRIAYLYDRYGNAPEEMIDQEKHLHVTALPDEKEMDKIWYSSIFSHRLSNLYAANTIPTKLRSLHRSVMMPVMLADGLTEIRMPAPGKFIEEALTDAEMEMMDRVEHNRWNVERLLDGYHPILDEDVPAFIEKFKILPRTYIDEHGNEKVIQPEKRMKQEYFTHPLIRPVDDLGPWDVLYDELIVGHMFFIMNQKLDEPVGKVD